MVERAGGNAAAGKLSVKYSIAREHVWDVCMCVQIVSKKNNFTSIGDLGLCIPLKKMWSFHKSSQEGHVLGC